MKLLNLIFGSRKKAVETKEDTYYENIVSYEMNSCALANYYENEEKISLVFKILESENFTPAMYFNSIRYYTSNTNYHEIALDNITKIDGKLAWLQSSINDQHLLRVFENNACFNWIPITYNQSWNCDCHLLQWLGDQLIFIYREKHDIYICAIKEQNVRFFNFHGEALERKNDIIFFSEYGNSQNYVEVRRIKIPELEELEPVSMDSLEKEDLVPKSVDYMGAMYLKDK
jgi:hypothetical protein